MQMAKGDQWERDLSKWMSLWWTEGHRDDVIWRVRASGSRATSRAKKGKATAGGAGDLKAEDIIAQPLFDYWLAEAKRGYDVKKGKKTRNNESINVLYWLDKPHGTKHPRLYQWWLEADAKRKQQGRFEAVIIFRRTGKRAVIMMRAQAFGDLHHWCGNYEGITIDIRYGNTWEQGAFTLLDLEDFFAWCSPESIKQALAERQQGVVNVRPKRVLIM
jgi:hypothetical protein